MSETRRSVDIKRFPTLSFPPPSAPAAATPPAGLMAAERSFELTTIQEHLSALTQRVQELARMTHQLRDELRVVQAVRAHPIRAGYSSQTADEDTVRPPPPSVTRASDAPNPPLSSSATLRPPAMVPPPPSTPAAPITEP